MSDDVPLRQALKRVATTLKAHDVPFALTGGYASWARGGPEPDHDADLLIRPEDAARASAALAEEGLVVLQPPEDWLLKAYDGDCLVDLIHRPAERPVTAEQLERTDDIRVDSVLMPVVSATDLLLGKVLVLTEQCCDFASLFPHVRALREQVDWDLVHAEAAGHPLAQAFLQACQGLALIEPRDSYSDRLPA